MLDLLCKTWEKSQLSPFQFQFNAAKCSTVWEGGEYLWNTLHMSEIAVTSFQGYFHISKVSLQSAFKPRRKTAVRNVCINQRDILLWWEANYGRLCESWQRLLSHQNYSRTFNQNVNRCITQLIKLPHSSEQHLIYTYTYTWRKVSYERS